MRRMILLLFSIFIVISLNAQIIEEYKLSLEFFPEEAVMYGDPVESDSYLRGVSKTKFHLTDSEDLIFYLHGELYVDSIKIKDVKIDYSCEKVYYHYDYSRIALKVIISANEIEENTEMTIYYAGFFHPSKVRSLSDYMRIDKEEGVFLRSYGYSLWFPCFIEANKDPYEALFSSVEVITPEKYSVIVIGEEEEVKIRDGKRISLWKPGKRKINDLQIVAGEYKKITDGNVSVYYKNNREIGDKILKYSVELKKLFSEKFREIKNENYLHIVEMPRYGNISSGNMIGIADNLFNNFESSSFSKRTIAHELVHPYVQLPLKKDNPFYALVIEGFPSFFQIYALRKIDSTFDLHSYMKRKEKRYIKNKSREGYPVEKPILEIEPHEIGKYKDRFVLNDRVWLFMYDLWRKTGDKEFDSLLKELFSKENIDYSSFEKLITKYLPNYRERLDKWLNTTEFPEEMRIKEDKLSNM